MLPENVPAVQLVQAAAAPRLYCPGGQAAAVGRKEPGAHAYPALQLPVQRALVMPDTAPYRPAAQLLQTPAPPKLYCPAGHTIAVALVQPAAHACPALHSPVHDDDTRPLMAPYVPAGHGAVHAAVDRAGVAPYRPAAQLLQMPAPSRLYCPAGQMAAVALVDPATQKYPAAQLPLQLTDGRPAVAPYVPAGHRLHWPAPPALYWPATHIAAVALVEPATQAYPALQLPLQPALDRPAVAPYVPEGQGAVHAADGSAMEAPYSPGLQFVHALDPLTLNLPSGHVDAMGDVDPTLQ